MKNRQKYIDQLEEFKSLIRVWEYGTPTSDTRSKINRKINSVKNILKRAGVLKLCTISPPPMIGGPIMRNIDPFTLIFDPPYGVSVIPTLVDMIDEAIGVIENDDNFSLDTRQDKKTDINNREISNRVFLVHGHDNELKEKTARFLEKLDLVPIILHEQPSKSSTIIEKFEKYSDVDFAVVLLTPDDLGGSIAGSDPPKKRARQNVIFELGYFLGKLGRENVVALIKDDDIEIPTDYFGVMYIAVDNFDAWKMTLAREIKDAGLKIDSNKVF
jgi:predicted nucleotide-binding protein